MKTHEKLKKEPFFLVTELPSKSRTIKAAQARYIPVKLQLMADGSYRAVEWKCLAYASLREVSSLTNIPRRTLARLAKCGLIRSNQPSPFIINIYLADIETLIAKTEKNPRYWDSVKRKCYLTGTSIQEAKSTY